MTLRGDQVAVRCVFMRGGTSRGAFLLADDLPADPQVRERLILGMYGSPDVRQIDGIGGADPLTSKVAIIGRSPSNHTDVDFTFGQVRIAEPRVDFAGTCGNLLAAVGPYAIDEGLVTAVSPVTAVRIHDVNTGKVIIAEVPTDGVRALTQGEAEIAGVPGRGVCIMLDFAAAAGSMTGAILPTGSSRDELRLDLGFSVQVSMVDVGNPIIFVRAVEVGLRGTETAEQLAAPEVLELLEVVRGAAGERLGLLPDRRRSAELSPAIPKLYVVAPPADYVTSDGVSVARTQVSLLGRGFSMQRPHKAYAVTAGISTAVAARIPGTVVQEVAGSAVADDSQVRIGHASGVMVVESAVEVGSRGAVVKRAALQRTARRIMDGTIYIPVCKIISTGETASWSR